VWPAPHTRNLVQFDGHSEDRFSGMTRIKRAASSKEPIAYALRNAGAGKPVLEVCRKPVLSE
jgi:hypothetical protein